VRRDVCQGRHRLVRQEWKYQAGQDQELPGSDDLADFEASREAVKFLARGQQQHSDDCNADRHPWRLSQRDRPEQIRQDVTNRHYQPDIRAAFWISFLHVAQVVSGQPRPEHQQTCGQRQQVRRVEPVQECPR
jgi:hypothetical protein